MFRLTKLPKNLEYKVGITFDETTELKGTTIAIKDIHVVETKDNKLGFELEYTTLFGKNLDDYPELFQKFMEKLIKLK